MHGYMRRYVDTLDMQHPLWVENTSTIIAQRTINVCRGKVVDCIDNEKYNALILMPDRFIAIRTSIQLFPVICHDCQNWKERLCRKYYNPMICSPAGKWNITLSSWPRLPTLTIPDQTGYLELLPWSNFYCLLRHLPTHTGRMFT